MAIINEAITTADTSIYTSVGNSAITTMMFCNIVPFDPLNPTVGLTYLTLNIVSSGTSVSDTNMVVNAIPVAAGETVTFDSERMVLANGDFVSAKSAAPANLVVTISTLSV